MLNVELAIAAAMMQFKGVDYTPRQHDCVTFTQAYLHAFTGMERFAPEKGVCSRQIYNRQITEDILRIHVSDALGEPAERPPETGDVIVWAGTEEGNGTGIVLMATPHTRAPIVALTFMPTGLMRCIPANPIGHWSPMDIP